jgi:hypothetical protein
MQTIALVFFCSIYALAVAIQIYQNIQRNRKYYTFEIRKEFADDIIDKVLSVTSTPKTKQEAIEFAIRCGRIVCEEKISNQFFNIHDSSVNKNFYFN